MKLWTDLTPFQRILAGIFMLVAALVLPEIAILLQFGGMEIAFSLVLVGLTPALNWLVQVYQNLKNTLRLVGVVLYQSASCKPRVFVTQAIFCTAALFLTGSVALGMSCFMPALLLDPVLV